jgi:hypothetical protein
VGETGATLNGTVNPNGSNVTVCQFEYGTTTSYGKTMACSSLPGSGGSPVAVSAAITGLSAGTEYHYRLVAKNAAGESKSADQSFKTSAAKTETNTPPGETKTPAGETKGETSSKPASPTATVSGTNFTVTKSGALSLKVACATGAAFCGGTVVVRTLTAVSAAYTAAKANKKNKKAVLTLASTSFSIPGGQAQVVTLHLSAKARALLSRSHTLRVRVTISSHDSAGQTANTAAIIVLRPAKAVSRHATRSALGRRAGG